MNDYTLTPVTLADHLLEETQGELTPVQVKGALTQAETDEVERLCAADLVMKARRVKELAHQWDDITCAAYAKAMEARSLEFAAAASWLRRRLESRDLPAYLRATGAA